MKSLLSYIWCLPQNLLGLLFLLFIRGEEKHKLGDISFYYSRTFPGGISLGRYIILGYKNEKSVRHEYGHCIQSKMLGPLYLLVVGLPSLLHAAFCKCKNHSYYDVYPESWADRLGKVKR
jgi:hypothetical protein